MSAQANMKIGNTCERGWGTAGVVGEGHSWGVVGGGGEQCGSDLGSATAKLTS